MFTLGRKIDVHYPTNRWILMIALASTLLGMVRTGDFFTGFKIGGTIFLTWALGREVEPKREYAAFLGVAIAFLYSFTTDVFMVSLLELVFMMLLLRLINRTCGSSPTLLDNAVILGLAAYLYYTERNLVFFFLYVIGFLLSQLSKENQRANLLLIAGAGFVTGILFYLMKDFFAFLSPILSPWLLISLTLLHAVTSYLDSERTVVDDKGQLINSVRIARAQLFFALAVIIFAFLSNVLFGNMVVYVSTMAGTILYRPLNGFFHFEK